MKKALLLDVSAMMYRAFYAHMNFRTKGEPTGAIFGFTNTLLSAIDEFSPDYIGAAFDVKRKTLKRSEKYEGYKADRKPMPDDLRDQIPRIEDVLDGFGIERFKIEGHEADDVLGTLAKKLSADGVEVYILTGDKDLSQVLDENINIALLGKGEGKSRFKVLRTDEDVIEQLGVKAADIPNLFGLIGDTSDGIPGVRKVGTKKAVPMLEAYGNLEGIYENLDKLSDIPGVGKGLVKNIEEDKEMAFLSRDLATIDIDIPLEYSLEILEPIRRDNELFTLFRELEFRVLIKKLGLKESNDSENQGTVNTGTKKASKKIETNNLQFGLFDNIGASAPKIVEAETLEVKIEESIAEIDKIEETTDKVDNKPVLMDILADYKNTLVKIEEKLEEKSDEEIKELEKVLLEGKEKLEEVTLKYSLVEKEELVKEVEEVTEERGLLVVKCLEDFDDLKEVVKKEGLATVIYSEAGFALSTKKRDYYLPLNHEYIGAFNLTVKEINDLFNEDIKFVSYKFKEILKAGYEFKNIYFDAMIAYYLLTAYTKEEVDTLIYNETGEELESYKEVFGKEELKKIDVDKVGEYLAKRSRGVYDLQEELEERLVEDGLMDLYRDIEMPLMPILAMMEKTGIAIDPEYFEKFW